MNSWDLVIWDSTPAGLIAAVAGARAGLRTVVITEDQHLGGVQTSGLGWTNAGQRETVGGLAAEFFGRVLAEYQRRSGGDPTIIVACQGGFRFESSVAEAVYEAWLAECGVTVLRQQSLVSVERDGPQLHAVVLVAGARHAGRVFVDASYEGDLLALAGCSWRLGREGQAEYDESLAGQRWPPALLGQPSEAIQPMDWRLCLTKRPELRQPFPKPERYRPGQFAWLAAQLRAKPPASLANLLPFNPMPNGKTDSRTAEWTGAGHTWSLADAAGRARIWAAHRDYALGFLDFLGHDPSVPEAWRAELAEWGLAGDEFADNGNWPYHIYVRQGRRLVGDWVMTQADVIHRHGHLDSVALGCFFLDVHAVQRLPDPEAIGGARLEGSLGKQSVRAYEIPFRALLPKASEVCNLLVPVGLAATHVAYSTLRMEPVFMMLGHAAGVAASMHLTQGTPLARLGVDLRQALAQQGQRVDAQAFPDYWPPDFQRAKGR